MRTAHPPTWHADLGDPFSRALIPLALGITRKVLLRSGMCDQESLLGGIHTHFYHAPATPGGGDLPVVLIHGIADSALTWAFTIGGFRRIGPVYAVDLPGFGLSAYPPGRRFATIVEQVAVVQDLVRKVVGRPALLVGNSMGGWIAGRFAELSPELARGIVLIDPGGAMLNGRASWEPFVRTVQVPDLATVRLIYRQMFGRTPLALYLGQRSFQDLFLRDAVQRFVDAASEDDFFTPEDLQRISVPSALVWGGRDTFLPTGSYDFFRTYLPACRVLMLPGCGHLPQRERPRRLVRFVRDFATSLQ